MYKTNSKRVFFYLLEIVLLVLSYTMIYWLKTESLFFNNPLYLQFVLPYLVFWTYLSFYFNKFNLVGPLKYHIDIKPLLGQSALILLILSLVCSVTRFNDISRLFLLQIVYLPILIEIIFVKLVLRQNESSASINVSSGKDYSVEKNNYFRMLFSAFILIIAFGIIHILGFSEFISYKSHEPTILLLIFSWMIGSFLTGKFKPHSDQNFYYKLSPFLKSSIMMIFTVSLVFYFGRLEDYLIRIDLFMTVGVYSFLEMFLALLYFRYFEKYTPAPFFQSISHFEQEILDGSSEDPVSITNRISFLAQLNNIKYEYSEKVHFALESFLTTNKITPARFRIIYDRTNFNIELFKPASLTLLLNYLSINDIKDLNGYFHACHNAIKSQGYLVGLYLPQDYDRKNLEDNMPRSLFVLYYPMHFIITRLIPVIPGASKIYLAITGGRNKLLSKAEVWGRLAYAGFAVKQEYKLNGQVLFIAQKMYSPANEMHPSESSIIKLKRVGLNGKTIRIYKLRTMFPYSEFIQNIVFEQGGLQTSGDKLNNDFRKTAFGNYMRKFWLDELPQLINWIKGDISLVGVRALSQHKYEMYPEDLKKLRTKFKPGIIPPFYADNPNSFEELLESERIYLQNKISSPFRTDFNYFWRAFYNIVVNGVRSS
jgi:hypothetical protein